jgi:protein-tyrosine-phosphatase/predicted ATP-grasp superfamily ATP-dependent carboligase
LHPDHGRQQIGHGDIQSKVAIPQLDVSQAIYGFQMEKFTRRQFAVGGVPEVRTASGEREDAGVIPTLRILVTDADSLPALSAVRSLGRAGHHVVVAYTQNTPRPATAFSRYVRERLTHPHPWHHQQEFRAWLIKEIAGGAYDVLLPISEAAIMAAAAHRQELSPYVQLLIPSDEALNFTLSKYNANRAALRCGLSIPATVFLRHGDQAADASDAAHVKESLASLTFPIIVKVDNHLEPGGRYVKGSVRGAATLSEAEAILEEYRGVPASIIAQEKIRGHGVGAFLLRQQGCSVLTFAHRRLHEFPYTGGISSLRAASADPAVIAAGEKLLAEIGFEGLAMIEFRQPADGGAPRFLEINGRIWGSMALALHAGVDFPRAWLECRCFGTTSVVQPRYSESLRCRNTIPGELLYLRSVLRADARTAEYPPPSKLGALAEFVRLSLDPRVRTDSLSLSDPAPWLGAMYVTARLLLLQSAQHVVRRLRRLRNLRHLRESRRTHEQRAQQEGYFPARMSTILFVCAGNICRSPFVEKYWNQHIREQWPNAPLASSAGLIDNTGTSSPPHCVAAARRFGVDLTSHSSQVVRPDLLEQADAVFVMDLSNYRILKQSRPGALNKAALLGLFNRSGAAEISDPYSMGFRETVDVYEHAIKALKGLAETMALSGPQPREAREPGSSGASPLLGTRGLEAISARAAE